MCPVIGYPETPISFFGRRNELDAILTLAAPRKDQRSAVVLIEGPGGIGKTMLVRQALDEVRKQYPTVRCVGPLDMDDTSFRVASNTGMNIATTLGEEHFAGYIEASRKYQGLEAANLNPEAIRFQMAMGDHYFITDYAAFARTQRVVLLIDTIEAIRGTHIWAYFLRMMAVLPNTLLVLAGRRKSSLLGTDEDFDSELDRFRQMKHIGPESVQHIVLAGWPAREARDFVSSTQLGRRLPESDLIKLLHLSRCQPLHLALALEMRRQRRFIILDSMDDTELQDIPLYRDESETFRHVDSSLPPDMAVQDLSERGKELIQAFNRELLLHLAGTDTLAQTMRRLAHVRRPLNEAMYQKVLDFEPAISNAPTWKTLQQQPWVRRRAEDHISLHDIVSELIQRYIWPVRDPDGSERRRLSWDCVKLYDVLLREQCTAEQQASSEQATMDIGRQNWVLEAERLYYLLDADLTRGYADFIEHFDRTTSEGRFILREMILGEMEGFASGFGYETQERYQIGLRQIDAAIEENLLTKAAATVELLSCHEQDAAKHYELLNLRANICMRTPGEVETGLEYFEQAVQLAGEQKQLTNKRSGALRELGWAYRQLGRWREAAIKYREALVATELAERKPRAQIMRNLAYVESLNGNYLEAQRFIDRALAIRREEDDKINLGLDLSVLGEIYRYQRQFGEAHAAYDEAIGLFSEAGASGWLGLVQQEKAICLIQESTEPSTAIIAEQFITSAISLCREFSPRNYPGALNRAGRIYVASIVLEKSNRQAHRVYRRAFEAFREGVEAAERVQDTWFEIANAIEYAELALHLWEQTGTRASRERIYEHERTIESKENDLNLGFSDLFGRWHLVKGHVAWREGFNAHDSAPDEGQRWWNQALEEYAMGFSLITKGYFGSHGVRAVPRESAKLREHILRMPTALAIQWCEILEERWGLDQDNCALLLALVDDLYSEVDRRRR